MTHNTYHDTWVEEITINCAVYSIAMLIEYLSCLIFGDTIKGLYLIL